MGDLRWRGWAYIDPSLKLTSDQCRRVHWRASVQFVKSPIRVGLLLSTQLIPFVILSLWGRAIGSIPESVLRPHLYSVLWLFILALGLCIILFIFALKFIGKTIYAPLVRGALSEVGHEVCLRCGYLLKALPQKVTNCPECGRRRKPSGAPDTTAS